MLLDFPSLTRYSACILNEIYVQFISNDENTKTKFNRNYMRGRTFSLLRLPLEKRVNDVYIYIYILHYSKYNLKNINCYCIPPFQRLRKYSQFFTEKRIKCNSTIHLDLFALIVTL